jgi:translation initiation factor IF-2
MRVYELAKELGISSKQLLAKLADEDIILKSHMNQVDNDIAEYLRSEKTDHKNQKKEKIQEKPQRDRPKQQQTDKGVEAEVKRKPPVAKAEIKTDSKAIKTVKIRSQITVRDLAGKLEIKPNQLITELMMMNEFASINDRLDIKKAQRIGKKHGVKIEQEKRGNERIQAAKQKIEQEVLQDKPEDLNSRAPVITFLGHIDHGKTSLLDKIRNTSVANKEAGKITQHIGAYTVNYQGKNITCLDTPGHAAFTAMRARGANLTDIAVIVIAADDGIMPQTMEAIKHAQAAKTNILVAINKIDLPAAQPEKAMKQLQQMELTPEEWGGSIICCKVSAATGEGLSHLMEMILLQAEMLELTANPNAPASGYVIESQIEEGMGATATVIVTRGTLKVGDTILCGVYYGKIRALINDKGEKIQEATPSTPAKCMGLSGAPLAGEAFQYYQNEKKAKAEAEKRISEQRRQKFAGTRKVSLDDLLNQQQQNMEIPLIIKCDTQGSIEAIQKALEEVQNEKISIKFLLTGVGNINTNDVLLASASQAIIIGFNVSTGEGANTAAAKEGVEIRLYSIIYKIIDDMNEAVNGMLEPETKEKAMGSADIKEVFSISKTGKIAGCIISQGKINTKCRVRVKRNDDVIFEGAIHTIKRFQNTVKEVIKGQECGIRLQNFAEFNEGDKMEFYELEKKPQKKQE